MNAIYSQLYDNYILFRFLFFIRLVSSTTDKNLFSTSFPPNMDAIA